MSLVLAGPAQTSAGVTRGGEAVPVETGGVL